MEATNAPEKRKLATQHLAYQARSVNILYHPFRCPATAMRRSSDQPARKRKKVSYADAEISGSLADEESYHRGALANRDPNRFPVYQVKNKDTQFRQQFKVPLLDKSLIVGQSDRPSQTLGMRKGLPFIARPLHDPCADFAIVLFDPTIHGPTVARPEESQQEDSISELRSEKLNVPLMHKSLAEILGIKKEIKSDQPKLPVVIDPKLAKVLRPHQVEGVKVDQSPLLKRKLSDG